MTSAILTHGKHLQFQGIVKRIVNSSVLVVVTGLQEISI